MGGVPRKRRGSGRVLFQVGQLYEQGGQVR